MKEILSKAEEYVKIIDPWVSISTLDHLMALENNVMVQILCSNTGGKDKERRFLRAIKNFKIEKPNFSLRKVTREEMHDRWIISDQGIWSLSQSINNIGQKNTIALIAPHSAQIKRDVKLFFDNLWSKAVDPTS